jgi:hypothetical protein
VDLFEMWICSKCGFVRNVDLFEMWICSKCGFVRNVDLFEMWICSKCGYVRNVDLFEMLLTKKCRNTATSSLVCFENKNILFYNKKCRNLLQRWRRRRRCKFKRRRIGSRAQQNCHSSNWSVRAQEMSLNAKPVFRVVPLQIRYRVDIRVARFFLTQYTKK